MTGAGRPDEDGLIARYFRPLATAPGVVGITFDAHGVPLLDDVSLEPKP